MAFTLEIDGNFTRHTDIQTALDDFMESHNVEWMELQETPIDSGDTPWKQFHEEQEAENLSAEVWSYVTQAVFSENGHEQKLPANRWCPPLLGPILIYSVCVSQWDGSQFKCPSRIGLASIKETLSRVVATKRTVAAGTKRKFSVRGGTAAAIRISNKKSKCD